MRTLTFEKGFEKLIPIIKKRVFQVFKGIKTNSNYKTIWYDFQHSAIHEIAKIIKDNISGTQITLTEAKGVYPDIKVVHAGKMYAIDIKSGASGQDPWYDIARLDTLTDKRSRKFAEEFDVVIKYDQKTGKVENVFVEPMWKTVGQDSKCKGVKYRPYDGKLRPKPWHMFESGKSYWSSKQDFVKAVEVSTNFRKVDFITKWWAELPKRERDKLRKTICAKK